MLWTNVRNSRFLFHLRFFVPTGLLRLKSRDRKPNCTGLDAAWRFEAGKALIFCLCEPRGSYRIDRCSWFSRRDSTAGWRIPDAHFVAPKWLDYPRPIDLKNQSFEHHVFVFDSPKRFCGNTPRRFFSSTAKCQAVAPSMRRSEAQSVCPGRRSGHTLSLVKTRSEFSLSSALTSSKSPRHAAS